MLPSIEGAQEEAQALRNYSQGIMDVAFDTLQDGSEAILRDIQDYPSQPPAANPQRMYVRGIGIVNNRTGYIRRTSENYGPTTNYKIDPGNGYVESVFSSPASYSSYVRGNLDDYIGPAWMHKGTWDTVTDITGDNIPKIEQNLESSLARHAEKTGV